MPQGKAGARLPGQVSERSIAGRPRGWEWAAVGVVVSYAGLLLAGPLAAIFTGAVSSGGGELIGYLTSADAKRALVLTLGLTLGATTINTVFGIALALVLTRDDFRGRRVLNALVDLPLAVSPVVAGFAWLLLFGREGWFAPAVDSLGVQVAFAWPGILLATIFVSAPLVAREIIPVLMHAGVGQEQAAYTLGAGAWRTFRRITLPNIRWGLMHGVSLAFARAMGEFGAVLVIGGGVTGVTETATLFIYRSLDDRREAAAFAVSLLLAAISFGVLLVMKYSHREGEGALKRRKGGE
ncbi:MAG: sulfate ABC transporter permease subunit [Acidobacteria bacterium]|nr:sulfate ABC transporter permease subunit [Acidobacteriota bacterium]MCW5969868.1 sulfate ABC transporter permease subunit [Blastocatellales bacterium]